MAVARGPKAECPRSEEDRHSMPDPIAVLTAESPNTVDVISACNMLVKQCKPGSSLLFGWRATPAMLALCHLRHHRRFW